MSDAVTEKPGPHVRRWLNPANAVTGLRLVMAPACAWAIGTDASGVALTLFCLAVVSDFADGPLARRRGEASPLGGLLDHATDATFVTLGLAALSARGDVPWLLPCLVALAFVQYTLDSRALRGRNLRASALGRWNGIAYFVLLGIPVVRDGLALPWPGDGLIRLLAWALVVSTLLSIANRLNALLRPGSS